MIQWLVNTDNENQRLKCQRMNCERVSASDDLRTSRTFLRASHEFVAASQIEHTSVTLVVRINALSTFQFQDLRMQQRHQWGGQKLYNRNFKKMYQKNIFIIVTKLFYGLNWGREVCVRKGLYISANAQ